MPSVCWEGQLCVSEFVTINSRCMDFLRSTAAFARVIEDDFAFYARWYQRLREGLRNSLPIWM